jgi:hypothetical protein
MRISGGVKPDRARIHRHDATRMRIETDVEPAVPTSAAGDGATKSGTEEHRAPLIGTTEAGRSTV